MRILLVTLLCLSTISLSAQLSYPHRDSLLTAARQNLDSLTSKHFYGRGYQKEGHHIAADFIQKRFEEIGLEKVGKSYQQPFSFNVNTVLDAALTLGEKEYQAGKNFIAHAQSGTGSLELRVIDFKHGLSPSKKARNQIVVIREGLPEKIQLDPRKRALMADAGRDDTKLQAFAKFNPAGVIILRKKLTAALRPDALPFPVLEMQEDAFPSKKVKLGSIAVNTKVQNVETQNILGYLEGTGDSDSVIVLTAHYDHLGGYSGAIFTGANDNASGTSMLLSIAEHFVQNRPTHNMLFIAFGAEEAGLKGSAHYVFKDARIPLSKMKFLLNLDLMGNGVDGIMAVGGKNFPGLFDQLVSENDDIEAVPRVRARQNAPNSDHYFFLENGVPGFFIYTMGGPPHYHDVNDTAKNLLFSKFVEVRELLIRFINGL
ncbi:MAG: M28 family metallopeptidase [Bacteroidia bacterium]